jgi:hypothetical protein
MTDYEIGQTRTVPDFKIANTPFIEDNSAQDEDKLYSKKDKMDSKSGKRRIEEYDLISERTAAIRAFANRKKSMELIMQQLEQTMPKAGFLLLMIPPKDLAPTATSLTMSQSITIPGSQFSNNTIELVNMAQQIIAQDQEPRDVVRQQMLAMSDDAEGKLPLLDNVTEDRLLIELSRVSFTMLRSATERVASMSGGISPH